MDGRDMAEGYKKCVARGKVSIKFEGWVRSICI